MLNIFCLLYIRYHKYIIQLARFSNQTVFPIKMEMFHLNFKSRPLDRMK